MGLLKEEEKICCIVLTSTLQLPLALSLHKTGLNQMRPARARGRGTSAARARRRSRTQGPGVTAGSLGVNSESFSHGDPDTAA